MNKYVAFFRMRFIAGLQYRSAAIAGIATQFVWGALNILMYKAFYEADAAAFPMSFRALSSYIWLQQALLAIFMTFILDNELFQLIQDGGIAYELCRPIKLYDMWLFRTMADRLSKAVLRCIPILTVAAFLPYPYGLCLPISIGAAVWFMISSLFAFGVVVTFCMLIYISTFFMISSSGIRIMAISVVDFLSGGVIPLPFLPEGIRQVVEILPFASMENVPLRIYSGDIKDNEIIFKVLLQLFWLFVLMVIGKWMTAKVMKRIIVQGG